MAKLSQTQSRLIALARKHDGRVYFQTYAVRKGRFRTSVAGGRDYQAAEGLVKLGVFRRERTEAHHTVRTGGKYDRWTDHYYTLTEAAQEAR